MMFGFKNKAFSLTELIIVMLVIGILAIASVFISFGPNKLIGTANKLMFDLRYAQQLAVSRQVSCGVSFNLSDNSYFVYLGDTSTKATSPYSGGELLVNYNTESEYKGIRLASTNFGDLISFNYLGIPFNGSGIALSSQGIITLQSGAYTKTITIEPNTGAIRIQ